MVDSSVLSLYGDLLRRGAREIDLDLGPDQLHSFALYAHELLRWNRRMNLTSLREEQQIVVHHFLGSLVYALSFDHTLPLFLVDIGSGAGFPGIPLKIACPHLEIILVEASRKKSSFLHHILALLHLSGIECLRIRAEELIDNSRYQGRFDLVLARAVGAPDMLHRAAAALLMRGGLLIVSGKSGKEMPESEHPSLAFQAERLVQLPSFGLERRLLTWERRE